MQITMKYDRTNFFGTRTYCEDVRTYATVEDIKKCFRYLKKHPDSAVQIDEESEPSTIYYWETWADYDLEKLTIKQYDRFGGYSLSVASFDNVKNELYNEHRANIR